MQRQLLSPESPVAQPQGTNEVSTPSDIGHQPEGKTNLGHRFGIAQRHLALLPVLALSALANFWSLRQVGWGNAYYAAGVRSMGTSLKSFFFNALDSGNYVTVDKPPMALWIQTISTKIFGYNQYAILVPGALMGTLSVALLYVSIQRSWGRLAGLVAATALALAPITVMANHTNNTDATLVFLMTATAVSAVEAARRGTLRWLVGASVLGGMAVLTKMAAAVPVLPGLFVAYVWCAPLAWRRRAFHSAIGILTTAAVGLSWFVAMEIIPATSRPYIGSTQKNSSFELAFERNGVNQVEGTMSGLSGGGRGGAGRGGAGFGPPNGGGFGGQTGTGSPTPGAVPANSGAGGAVPTDGNFGGLLPGLPPIGTPANSPANSSTDAPSNSAGSAAAGATATGASPIGSFGGLLPGGIGGSTGFSGLGGVGLGGVGPGGGGPGGGMGIGFSGGEPGTLRLFNSDLGTQNGWLLPVSIIGALSALCFVGLRGSRRLAPLVVFGGWFAIAAGAFSITKGIVHPYYLAQLGPPIAALVGIGVATFVRAAKATGWRRILSLAFPVALALTAWAQWVIARRVPWRNFGAPLALAIMGVAVLCTLIVVIMPSKRLRWASAAATLASLAAMFAPASYLQGSLASGTSGTLPYAIPYRTQFGAGLGGGIIPNGGFQFSRSNTASLVAYLRANRTTERWLLGVPSAGVAEPIIITTGEPVMATGGFVGSDPILTEKSLRAHITNGRIRYFMTSAGGFGGGAFGGGPFGNQLGGQFGGRFGGVAAEGAANGNGGANRGGGPFVAGGFVPPRLAAMRSNIVTSWVTAKCTLVDEAIWNKPAIADSTKTVTKGTSTAQAFPGGPTAGQFTLYDCKAKG
jgi:4-amino-4-deoxy-L-arabinose transferase-like glycosyltransferase